jgi:serine/threonine protein kinase
MLSLYRANISSSIASTLLLKSDLIVYNILKNLPSGASGNTFHVIDQYNREYTIKRYKKTIKYSTIFNEINKLKYVNASDNISLVYPQNPELLYDNNGLYHLQYKYIDGKCAWTLQYKILKNRDILQLKEYIWNICNIAHKLQQYCNITHLDIKPDNLINTDANELKLIDFGSSRFLDHCDPKNNIQISKPIGSPSYAAPEIFNGYYNCKSDVYCIGRIFRFFSENKMNIGSDGIKLLSNMLEPLPNKRPSVSDVLSHTWFSA